MARALCGPLALEKEGQLPSVTPWATPARCVGSASLASPPCPSPCPLPLHSGLFTSALGQLLHSLFYTHPGPLCHSNHQHSPCCDTATISREGARARGNAQEKNGCRSSALLNAVRWINPTAQAPGKWTTWRAAVTPVSVDSLLSQCCGHLTVV